MLNARWHAAHRVPKGATPARRLAWHLEHEIHCGCRPMPEALRAWAGAGRARSLRSLLEGGDRRSIAGARLALASVRRHPERTAELALLARDPDWLVSLRALDVLEKLAHEDPARVAPHKRLFIGRLAASDKWEVRLQIVRALPLFEWNARERLRVLRILRRDARHPQTFVRAWAVDGLATFADRDRSLRALVARHLRQFERSRSPALRARANTIRTRLGPRGRATPRPVGRDRRASARSHS